MAREVEKAVSYLDDLLEQRHAGQQSDLHLEIGKNDDGVDVSPRRHHSG